MMATKNYVVLGLVILYFVCGSLQMGTIYTNKIVSNGFPFPGTKAGHPFPGEVQIEETRWDENSIRVDIILGITSKGTPVGDTQFGTEIEESICDFGSVYIPHNLEANLGGNPKGSFRHTTVSGQLNFNGGLLCDDGLFDDDLGGFSFKTEDDTGITTINGELRPELGVDGDFGLFHIDGPFAPTGEPKHSGETFIEGLTRPNGGIYMTGDVPTSTTVYFIVDDDDGDVWTAGSARIEHDIIMGTNENREGYANHIYRDLVTTDGADTYIVGQSADVLGGSIILEPGYAASNGKLIFGRVFIDQIDISRRPSEGNGGKTYVKGQDASLHGGALVLGAGDGGDDGGNVVLVPGDDNNGAPGDILLGSVDPQFLNRDLFIERPAMQNTQPGGDLFFEGQDSFSDNGGDLHITVTRTPGTTDGSDIYLQPGNNDHDLDRVGSVYIGNADEIDFLVTLIDLDDDDNAGAFTVAGQDSLLGAGGHLVFRGGNGASSGNGGSLVLEPGRDPITDSSFIFVGDDVNDLAFVFPEASQGANGHTLHLFGQNNGGDFNIWGGDVTSTQSFNTIQPGSIWVFGGAASAGVGGGIRLTAGSGANSGGDVRLNGDDITVYGGDGAAHGGDIVLAAGNQPLGLGQTLFTDLGLLYLDAVPFHIYTSGASQLRVFRAGNYLDFGSSPGNLINHNGIVLLRERITITAAPSLFRYSAYDYAVTDIGIGATPGPAIPESQKRAIDDLENTLSQIVAALSSHHGLVEAVTFS